MKGHGKKNMYAAKKISLQAAGWTDKQQQAWDTIKKLLLQTIITSLRDRNKQAVIFTDASETGWVYAITQCEPGELEKPWED